MENAKQDAPSSVFDLYATDDDAEQNGQWVEFRGGVKVRVRSDQSDKVREYVNKTMKKQRQAYIANGGILPHKMSDRNDVLLCANAVVSDWEGVIGEDGKPLPCTPANVEAVLTKAARFRNDILTASRTEETFRSETKSVMAGNSKTTSPSS